MVQAIPVEGLRCQNSFERPHLRLVAVQEILMLVWTQATRLDLDPLDLEQQQLLKETQTLLRLLMT